MKKLVRSFLNWWMDAPLYKSFWFIPVVALLYVFSVIKNFAYFITGEHKNGNNN